MTPYKVHVALDIDGVLFPWDKAAAEALEQMFGYEGLTREQSHWNELKDQVSKAHWGWLFTEEGARVTLSQPSTYPGVPKGLLWLGQNTHLTFITHRPASAAATTAQWIASHGCQFESLHVVGRNGSDHLPKWAVKPEADIYVEDRYDNVRELLYNTEKAIVMMPRRPYNRDLWDASVVYRTENEHIDPLWAHRLHAYDEFSEVAQFVYGFGVSYKSGAPSSNGVVR